MKQMQQRLKLVDLVIEVHDARIPFSGRNITFQNTITPIKPYILVLNKKDLSPSMHNKKVKDILKAQDIKNVVYTNCKDDRDGGVKLIYPLMQDLIQNSNRYNRTKEKDFNIMIIGVPNVGKSSLINKLRNRYLKKGSASPVGAVPGITRGVLTRIKISEDPLIYMFDTPGILTPNVETIEMGLKLALCHCLQDHLVGEEIIADYLLFLLNKYQLFDYVKLTGLKEPCDEIHQVLVSYATKNNWYKVHKRYDNVYVNMPDVILAATQMIKAFRAGSLGLVLVDEGVILEKFEKLKNNLNTFDQETLLEKDKVL